MKLIFLICMSYVFSQTKHIDTVVKQYHNEGKFNGAILVVNDTMIYKNALGYANREWKIHHTIDTKFRIGSLTKQFVSVLILQLASENKLKLSETISKYLPWYKPSIGKKVTIHQLLSHTSGIPNYSTLEKTKQNQARKLIIPTKEFINAYCSEELFYNPGSDFNYSNSNYLILGEIIETITGKSLEEVLQNNILTPLNMNNSGVDDHHTIIPKKASGYLRKKGDTTFFNPPFVEMQTVGAAGTMYSTIEDLHKWYKALKNETLLSKKYTELLFRQNKNEYSYGFHVEKIQTKLGNSLTHVFHSGMLFGYYSRIDFALEKDFCTIILTNTKVDNRILRDIAKICLPI